MIDRFNAREDSKQEYQLAVLRGLGYDIPETGAQALQTDGRGNSAWQQARAMAQKGNA